MPARFWPVPCWVFLSTPSARRATYELGFTDVDAIEISIHALREEGDLFCEIPNVTLTYFYPRPPRGGRHSRNALRPRIMIFLSTPSARRATVHPARSTGSISNFYPRPPRGGRLVVALRKALADLFLSTPSARRATSGQAGAIRHGLRFLSTPSARRATPAPPGQGGPSAISIHALREEGDEDAEAYRTRLSIFLSTPSARRATAKTETKSLFSYKLYNILHEFRRALIYNGSKNDPNHAKRLKNPVRRCRKNAENSPFAPGRKTQNNSRPSCSKGG